MSNIGQQLPPDAHVLMQAATAQFQRAAGDNTTTSYRLIYVAGANCGTSHNYENLRRAEKLGIKVEYVNSTSLGQIHADKINGETVTAPGTSVKFEDNRLMKAFPPSTQYKQQKANEFLAPKGLMIFSYTQAVLIDANDKVVRTFESTMGSDFIPKLEEAVRPKLSEFIPLREKGMQRT